MRDYRRKTRRYAETIGCLLYLAIIAAAFIWNPRYSQNIMDWLNIAAFVLAIPALWACVKAGEIIVRLLGIKDDRPIDGRWDDRF